MSDQTNERAFETHVEETLLGASGWQRGANAEWDVERALFPVQVCNFLEATQPRLWADMRTLHGDGLETLLLASLVKELDLKGTLHVLRHGFKFYGKTFRLATFKPAHGLNDEVLSLYKKNRLTVTRQVLCHPGKHDTVDLMFALNGLPVATCELKNPGTGQSWRHAVRQYQKDRDPRAPLFRFKARALVHFAADPDEVHMATRLARAETHFLPFNRGSRPGEIECGAGNPQHHSGDRTGYFWCCFPLYLVRAPHELTGLFRRRISWDDGAIRDTSDRGEAAFLMTDGCRSDADAVARAALGPRSQAPA